MGPTLKKQEIIFLRYNSGKKEISILYELSYGYYLLGEDEDLILSKKYLKELLLIESKAHIEKIYKSKAIKLQNKITL